METIVRQNETFLSFDHDSATYISEKSKREIKRMFKKWLITQRNNDNSNSSSIIFSSLVRL